MIRIRPTFSQTIPLPAGEVQERIVRALEQDGGERFQVKNFPTFICLRIREQDRHFWTPRLTLSLEETAEGHTRIEGIYGPNANVWGLYLYGYLAIGMLGIFSFGLGFAQWWIGRHPWGLWIFSLLLVMAIAMHACARVGQQLGASQMTMLHEAYHAAAGGMIPTR